MTTTATTTIWQELESWSKNLLPWQRFVLTHAVNHGCLNDNHAEQAYKLFLTGNKLWNDSFGQAEEILIPAIAAPQTNTEHTRVLLTRLGNLQHVNAIPATSSLTFGPSLTVMYGHNGSGKSGFARVLCSACFSRAEVSILPNVYADHPPSRTQADFSVRINDAEETILNYTVGESHPDLLRFTVFNTEAAHSHLTDANPLGFKPMGFNVFVELTRIYGLLEQKLSADIRTRVLVNKFVKSFPEPASKISQLVASLSAETDLKSLQELAMYAEKEQARQETVVTEIAELKSKSVEQSIKEIDDASDDIKTLCDKLTPLLVHFQPAKKELCRQQLDDFIKKTAAATSVSVESFKQPFFTATGSPSWEEFVTSAAKLAKEEHEAYPLENAFCLLCQQPLDATAIAFIQRLWNFLDSTARTEALTASVALDNTAKVLKKLLFDFFGDDSRVRKYLQVEAPEITGQIIALLESLAAERDDLVQILERGAGVISSTIFADPCVTLEDLRTGLVEKKKLLQSRDTAAVLQTLEAELVELRHRQIMSGLIDDMATFIEQQKWLKRANSLKDSAFNTREITLKENSLFKLIIEGGYKDRFEAECKALRCEAPILLETKGKLGETRKTLSIKKKKPNMILSEGEQRIVALADFLTEVNLNPASAGVIFDDPVNSLDFQRRQLITKRLVQEAATRQVIIFTHDIVFLTLLMSEAETSGTAMQKHWIERDGDDNPGQVTLNDIPADCKTYYDTKKAKKVLDEARDLSGDQRVEKIRNGMGILRRCVEEAVLKYLFKDVVTRWNDRVMIGGLKKINWKEEFVDEIDGLYGELSRYVEGHSHTEEFAGGAPVIKDFEDMIGRVDGMIKKVKGDKVKSKVESVSMN